MTASQNRRSLRRIEPLSGPPSFVHDRRSCLLALYVGLLALRYAIYALPGLPRFRGAGELAFSVAIDVVLVVFIARGSRSAWVVALVLSAFFAFAVVSLSTGGLPPGTVAVLVVEVAAVVTLLLLSPHLRRDAHAGGRPRT